MSIELHIERLVIDAAVLGGERAGDVRAAIERELAQRLAQPGSIDSLRGIGTIDRLSTALMPAAHHPRESLGQRTAAAVGDRLGVPPAVALLAQHHATPGAQP